MTLLASESVSSIQINNSVFESNIGVIGSIILCWDSLQLQIDNSVFVNNIGILYGTVTASNLSYLRITNFVFDSQISGSASLAILINNADFILRNVTFKNLFSDANPGGAICFQGSGSVLLEGCTFINNTAVGYAGGAIAYHVTTNDKIKDSGNIKDKQPSTCINMKSHCTWSHNTSIVIQNCVFINNTASNGGALWLSGGNHTIKNSVFIDNFARFKGGHIYLDADSLTSLDIFDSKLYQQNSQKKVSHYVERWTYGLSDGVFINSQSLGPLIVQNSTLTSSSPWRQNSIHLVTVAKGNYIDFLGNVNNTLITCPIGHKQEVFSYTTKVNTEFKSCVCTISLTLLQITCKPCEPGTYSLQHGQSLGTSVVRGFNCLACPFGAECINAIEAKSNFWGYKVRDDPAELNFTLCPIGYCGKNKKSQTSSSYNSCHGNRTGPLCGKCKDNYTETLLSPSCRHSDECKDKWIWVLTVVMVTVMALYLIYKPDLLHMLSRQIVWNPCKGNKENNEPHDHRSHSNSGYLKIVFYFYQIANILLVNTSYNRIAESYILQPVLGIFNFQFRVSTNGLVCPFSGLTAVSKQVLMVSPVFGVLSMIVVIYYCHCLLQKYMSKPPPNKGPFLAAVLETLLLGYMTFANTSLLLLRCKSIGDDSRLFISGDVVCYQEWQFVLMGYVVTVIFPFVVTLALGCRWLHNDTISVKEFLLGCVVPLPYLVYKLISYCRIRRESRYLPRDERQRNERDDPRNDPRNGAQHDPRDCLQPDPRNELRDGAQLDPQNLPRDGLQHDLRHDPRDGVQRDPRHDPRDGLQRDPRNEPRDGLQRDPRNEPRDGVQRDPRIEPREWKEAILNVLCGPFQDDSSYARYWESVLISRRLAMIIIFVSVSDPFSKELLLILACVTILLHHAIVKPFRHKAANIVEMTSLFCLVVIAMINTFKESFLSFGQEPEGLGPLSEFFDIADWVQIVLLLLLPVICLLVVMMFTVILIIRVIIALVTCLRFWKKPGDELRYLLEPSSLDTEST